MINKTIAPAAFLYFNHEKQYQKVK